MKEPNPQTPRPVLEARKLAKTCDNLQYDYLIVVYKRPEAGQTSMEAEVDYKLTEPGNLGSLLATVWATHPDIAEALQAAFNFRAYAALQEQNQGAKIVKM